MRNALVKMGCWAATAWTLTTGGSLGAQEYQEVHLGAGPRPVARRTSIDDFAPWTEAHVRLAWLADPATFRLNLGAKVNNEGVIIFGFIPSEPMRQRVLQAAQESSQLRVIDALKIHTTLDEGFNPTVPAEELELAVYEMVRTKLGARGEQVRVRVFGIDQVVLEGAVAGLDERVQLSMACRGIKGCASVNNRLEMSPTVQPVSTHEADTSYVAPTPAPDLAYWQSAPTTSPTRPGQQIVMRRSALTPPAATLKATPAYVQTPALTVPSRPVGGPSVQLVAGTTKAPQAIVHAAGQESVGTVLLDEAVPVSEWSPTLSEPAMRAVHVDPAPVAAAPAPTGTTGPTVNTTGAPSEAARTKIASICWRPTRDVTFNMLGPRAVEIGVKIRHDQNFAPLSRRIGSLPELSGYQVTYNITVVP